MPYYDNNENEEQQPQPMQQAGNMAKKQAGKQAKKIAKKAGKAVAKLAKKAVMWFVKVVILPFLPYILAFLAMILLVYIAWDLIFNSRGKTQDYQTEDTQEYNTVDENEETGEIVATDLSFGNKVVKAFYTYFAERSIYITCPDDGVDEPIQYNSPDFISKYGKDGATEDFHDKYGREKMFYISPNALWSLDEFLNRGQFKFPEQFIKPVYNAGKDGNYELKQLTDSNGELIAQSQKYVETTDKKFEIPKEGETEEGIWSYGFGSILNYKKYEEEAKRMGTYQKIEVWNINTQKIDYVTLEEAKAGSESGKYEGYKDYIDDAFEEKMPSENKTSYMIDRVTSPAGTITNEIEQRWEDSGEKFSTTKTRKESVTVKYKETKTKKIHLDCNESQTVYTYVDLEGNKSKPITLTNTCKEDDHTLHFGVDKEYKVTYEKTKKEDKTLSVYIEGTIHRNIPRYVGSPDTSQITGSQYYRDYIRYYTTYAPESVLTKFDFKSMRDRTGQTDEELLALLERESFGGASSSSSGDFGDFEFGNGALGEAHKKALQHWSSFEKYGNMYGVDPYILVGIAVGESSGNHQTALATCSTGGCGIMRIENPGHTITSATAFNHETGQMDVMQVNQTNAKDVDTNIKIGAMLASNRMKNNNYNILMGVQSYNMGQTFDKHVMGHYLKKTGLTLEEAQADISNLSWLDSVVYVHVHPTEFIPSWSLGATICRQPECPEYGVSGNHYGGVAYIPRFMKNFASPNKEMWVLKEDGTKITLALDGTITISEGTNASGIGSGWLKKLWTKFTDKWQSLFPDIPEKLADERTAFENKVPENQIDTIIKMMFVMEEQKYLTDYDDWTDEVWKEKFALLFSNPVGTNWTSGAKSSVDVNQYFPKGFDLPLSMDKLTIKTGYSVTHMGVDIVAPKGTTVKAVADGEVVEVGNSSSKGGKYIRIKHEGGIYTAYGNLDNVSVKSGDKVTRGQSIGTTGSGSEGEVLHFELSKGETLEDPTWMITGFFNASDYNMTEEDAQIINQVIAMAKSKIGLRYTQEAQYRNGPNSFDCSGFVNWLYKQATGVTIGSWTGEQEQFLKNYQVKMSEIQPGDVIFGPGHVTLYIGNGRIIHASNPSPYPKGGVKESNLYSDLNRAYRPIAYIRAQQAKKN